jgi:hypothetical protein
MYATFFVRDKGIAKQFQRTKNVAEKKRTKGVSPTAFFRSPSHRQAAKRIQSFYVQVFCFYMLPIIFSNK